MILPLIYYGNPLLRKKTAKIEIIDAAIHSLVKDMDETLATHEGGVGLAAPQIGQSIALFITRIPIFENDELIDPGKLKVYINPHILSYSKELWPCQEECLSILDISEVVERPAEIKIQATDLNGHLFEETLTEFDAHVFLHENDHLNGVLFIDRLPKKKKAQIAKILHKTIRNK